MKRPLPLTPFKQHCHDWKDGCGSAYCGGAMRKTFYRGQIPADIVFVGEAPGRSENIQGVPFVETAPAGALLTYLIKQAIPKYRPHQIEPAGMEGELGYCPTCKGGEIELEKPCKPFRIGFTNIVICIPRLEGEEKVEPDTDQIETCKPRLEEIIAIANPRLIFAVGSQSRDALTQGYQHSTKIPKGCHVEHIVHPAWILRQATAFQGLEIQRVSCQIRDAAQAVFSPRKQEATQPVKDRMVSRQPNAQNVAKPVPVRKLPPYDKPKPLTGIGKSDILKDDEWDWNPAVPLTDEDIPF